jgi:hypothetical protein
MLKDVIEIKKYIYRLKNKKEKNIIILNNVLWEGVY